MQRVRKEVGEAVHGEHLEALPKQVHCQSGDGPSFVNTDRSKNCRKTEWLRQTRGPVALPEVPHSLNISSADCILATKVSETVMEVCFIPSGHFCCLISEL